MHKSRRVLWTPTECLLVSYQEFSIQLLQFPQMIPVGSFTGRRDLTLDHRGVDQHENISQPIINHFSRHKKILLCVRCSHLISSRPLDLGAELLHGLVQAAVAAQLRLDGGQVVAPLSFIHAPLVLLHPAQEVLEVAHGDHIQLRVYPLGHGGLLEDLGGGELSHGDLRGGHAGFEAQVVLAAEVHQPLVETINSRGIIRK